MLNAGQLAAKLTEVGETSRVLVNGRPVTDCHTVRTDDGPVVVLTTGEPELVADITDDEMPGDSDDDQPPAAGGDETSAPRRNPGPRPRKARKK